MQIKYKEKGAKILIEKRDEERRSNTAQIFSGSSCSSVLTADQFIEQQYLNIPCK